MFDYLGNEISVNSIVLYGNNIGFITLALVNEIEEDRLHVIRRGYRDLPLEKDLLYPHNVLVVTDAVLNASDNIDASELDINFMKAMFNTRDR
jgi:hypothetical protein